MPEFKGYVDPLCIRDRVISQRLDSFEVLNGGVFSASNPSRPFAIQRVIGYAEVGVLSSLGEFENKLETLARESYSLAVSGKRYQADLLAPREEAVQDIFECMRFFWEEDGIFDLNALLSIQRAVNYPFWRKHWKFTDQFKPPHQFSERYGVLSDFYKRLEVGSRVRPRGKPANEGISGELLGFMIGPQAQFNMDNLIVCFKDDSDWLYQRYLYSLEMDEI